MKIGIVTFWGVPNYGAMLQAYALWHYLEARGHSVEFIDYDFCRSILPSFVRCFLTRHISAIRNRLKMYFSRQMLDFVKTFPRTRRFSSYNQLIMDCPRYDYLIVGSDQMWNPMWLTGDRLRFVMLDFVDNLCHKLACSVSFGTDCWPEHQDAVLAGELMRRFLAISVREESGVNLVRKLAGREDSICLIDPTMVYGADFYYKLFIDTNNVHDDSYVFEYFIENSAENSQTQDVIKAIMSEMQINKIKNDQVPVEGVLSILYQKIKVRSKLKVENWLSCLSNASFVCTNSFHGTVFSLLFHRPFITILRQGELAGMNERIISLLEKVGLSDRAVFSDEIQGVKNNIKKIIDWEVVDKRLLDERSEYLRFMQSAGL